MKQRFLLCAFSVFAFSAIAQDSAFQLKDYKYRTPGFRALTLSFNMNGGLSNRKLKSADEISNREISLYVPHLNYYRTISTDKRLHASSISLTPSFYSNSSKTNSKLNKSSNLNSNFTWHRADKFYNAGKWFFEAGNSLGVSYTGSRQRDTFLHTRDIATQLQNTVVLGVGKGRIENVQDAQMALYILNDLAGQGLLSAPVSAQTVDEFARLITSINNRRVFDGRKRRIFELTQVDAFLRNSGLVNETDIRHFTTVNDNWTLAFNPARLSGANWYARINPGLAFNNGWSNLVANGTKSEGSQHRTAFILMPELGYEKYVPVNLKWQRNWGASFQWQKNFADYRTKFSINNQTSRNNFSESSTKLNLHAFYGLGYYPNNRTQVTANLELNASRFINDKLKDESITQVKPAFSFSADYFISYQTRLYAQYFLGYQQNFFKHSSLASVFPQHHLSTSFSVGLTHILF